MYLKKTGSTITLFALATALASCIYSFEPKGIDEVENLLVVEGDIIANGVTSIKLSRSTTLTDISKPPVEAKALVTIESSTGAKYPATEASPGMYVAATHALDISAQYRLHILTNNGEEYASAFVPVCQAMFVDTIFYKAIDQKTRYVDIYASSASNSNNPTRYFRWICEEDWEYTASIWTSFSFDVVTRQFFYFTSGFNTYYCWNRQVSGKIFLDNTSTLSKNVIRNRRLLSIPGGDIRLSNLYSVRVKQTGLTEEAYTFWRNLLTNTEDLGTIFSPLPSEFKGNITCISHPKTTVLGFVNASTQSYSDRIFIPKPFPLPTSYACEERINSRLENDFSTAYNYYIAGWRPSYIDSGSGSVFWYRANCVDCRVNGGDKNKPLWWPNNHY